MTSSPPTIFHITHWKTGSQWVYAILKECAPERVISPEVHVGHFYQKSIVPGKIYPTVYVPMDKFNTQMSPGPNIHRMRNWYTFSVKKDPIIKFIVIRDLRDTLVSLYFSLLNSHPQLYKKMSDIRQQLSNVEMEQGLLSLMQNELSRSANIQQSWIDQIRRKNILMIKYEDLIARQSEEFFKIIQHCKLEVNPSKLSRIVEQNSFEAKTGRTPGDEDVFSHLRKGISGDWSNHFTDRIKDEFKEQFGQILIETGYEKDLNW